MNTVFTSFLAAFAVRNLDRTVNIFALFAL